VPFDTSDGVEMCREFAIAECPMCRAYVMGDRRYLSKQMSCWSCGARFEFGWLLEDEPDASGDGDGK